LKEEILTAVMARLFTAALDGLRAASAISAMVALSNNVPPFLRSSYVGNPRLQPISDSSDLGIVVDRARELALANIYTLLYIYF
jgi:hypothetical protein